jgi:hypothetical protein
MNRARRQEIEEGEKETGRRGMELRRDMEWRKGIGPQHGRGWGHRGAGQGRADLKQYVLASVYCI